MLWSDGVRGKAPVPPSYVPDRDSKIQGPNQGKGTDIMGSLLSEIAFTRKSEIGDSFPPFTR